MSGRPPVILKLGGELIETPAGRARLGALAASIVETTPLVVVHGGGRAIDAELARRSIAPRKIDGLRVTDAATLDAVVAVLAGSANTDLVAALAASGVAAVGLTGVDARLCRARRVRTHRTASGAIVDLGLVGDPTRLDARLVHLLVANRYVPVIASLGVDEDDGSTVLNVNADVMACRLAAAFPGARVFIAGATAGVLDAGGRTVDRLDADGIDAMIADRSATAGMIAKLIACRDALRDGAAAVRIVDGRALAEAGDLSRAPGTEIVAGVRAG